MDQDPLSTMQDGATDNGTPEKASAEKASAEKASAEAMTLEGESAAHRQVVERFVQFWGEMASNWGINRTMGQIHALLYCSEEPLNTDEIMEQLDISRGNANMNLRSLTDWKLVYKTRLQGSRKDYYLAEKDVWDITAQIIKERERRELKPVGEELAECMDLLVKESESPEALAQADRALFMRLQNLMQLMDVFEGFFEALLPYVKKQNVSMIKQLIQFAQALDVPDKSNA